mgnify:CR=1 FL=1
MKIIEAEGINKFFGTGQNRVHVLKDMSFAIEEGDFVAIIGQSGSGKSTLMNILGCLDTQSSGVCRIGGVDIGTLDSDELAELRGKRIGFIFQRYNLLSTLSATENVAIELGLKRWWEGNEGKRGPSRRILRGGQKGAP